MRKFDQSSVLRQVLGFCGMAMPILDWFFAVVFGRGSNPPGFIIPSISATHYYSSYALFECLVFGVGLFLICYQGYDIKDKRLSTAAGVGAIALVLFPCSLPGAEVNNFLMLPMAVTGVVHAVGALLFFGMLFWILEFQFTKKSGTIGTPRKRARNILYKVSGWVMLGGLVLGFGCNALFGRYFGGFVYLGEFISLEAFGIGWLVKGGLFLRDKQ
jgi:hypothetical protein